jgi:O-antigen/teichoic acid export membrane protein
MLLRRELDRLEEKFLDQFEDSGDGIVYRKHGRGAPVPVTEKERDEFRRNYRRSAKAMVWGIVGAVVITVAIGDFAAPALMENQYVTVVIGAVAIATIILATKIDTTAPARRLANRPSVGQALTKDEIYTRHFENTSWRLLIGVFVVSTLVCVTSFMRFEFLDVVDFIWAGGSATISLLGARALWLKRRYAP